MNKNNLEYNYENGKELETSEFAKNKNVVENSSKYKEIKNSILNDENNEQENLFENIDKNGHICSSEVKNIDYNNKEGEKLNNSLKNKISNKFQIQIFEGKKYEYNSIE